MTTTRKHRLSTVPKRRAVEPSPAAASDGKSSDAPNLDHIAEGLRPLASPLADLAFMVGNAVAHPEKQIAELRASLQQFGQVEALIVNRRENPPAVIGGNGRLQAMLAENWQYAAVLFVDLDRAKANALSLVLNRTADGRVWQAAELDALLRDVNTGCDPRLDAMLAELHAENPLPATAANATDPPPPPSGKTVTCPEC